MPIADPEARRAYHREWARKRRAALLDGAVCLRCGATERLEMHHFVASEKGSHRITSWRPERARAEMAKCVILCDPCHNAYHAAERRKPCGTVARYDRGCRCEPCRVAKAEKYRAKLAELDALALAARR